MSRLAQLLRRASQLAVVAFVVYAAFGGIWRNYKRAHNSARLVSLMQGEAWGEAYALNESMLGLLDDDTHAASLGFLGFPWAGRVGGVDTADPLMIAGLVSMGGEVPAALWFGLLVPLALALVFGKIFCSHLCPMRLLFELGEVVRAGVRRLGVSLPEHRSSARWGGFVLIGGVIATWTSSVAIWLLLLPYVSLSAGIFLLVTTGAATGLLTIVAAWWLVDVLVAPSYFCHNLCPTGFLLEQVGRLRLVRLRKRGDAPCPSGCNLCQRACPYGLRPKEDPALSACDGCGRCVASCPSKRLARGLPVRRRLPVLTAGSKAAAALLAIGLLPGLAAAHHNKGLPHYGYFENYPQVPTEEYYRIDGRWEIGATVFNFQGYELRHTSNTPNDVKIYLYLYDLEEDRNYRGPVDIEIVHRGEVVARFARTEIDMESIYAARVTLPRTGEYELVCDFDGERTSLAFYVDLDDDVDWLTILLVGGPLLLVLGLAIHGRKKRPRRRRLTTVRTLVIGALGSAFGVRTVASAQPALDECAPSDGARQVLTDEGPVLVMAGVPTWVLLTALAGIFVLSFVSSEWVVRAGGARGRWRKNLIRRPRVYRLVRSRWFQVVPQLVMVGVLAYLIYVGLAGSRVANLAPIAVWTLWWAGLVFTVLFFGAAWCLVCPWDALASLASRLRLAAKVEPLGLGLRYPPWLANLYPAIALFVLLTWLELGWGVTSSPRATAQLGLGMIALAVVGALLFDGKRFCAHACPVGRICGLYGNFAPVEVRARNPNVCARCTTEDCLHGGGAGYPCPTGISLKVVQDSTLCTMCTECVKSCAKQNVAINLRPFGADLGPGRVPRRDEAWLAVVLLALTLFHGLSMTAAWESFEPGRWSFMKWSTATLGVPRLAAFALGMVAFVVATVSLYQGACWLGARWSRDALGARELFARYSLSLIPIALFYHLAHNLMHLLMEGGHVVPLLSDPLGRGADHFGTADVRVGPLASDAALWAMQVGLILVGHLVGILVAHRIGHRAHSGPGAAVRSLLPMLAVMIVVSSAGVGLMHLDMNMRLGRM